MAEAHTVQLTDAQWARIWARVDRTGDCWRWLGMKSQGYGRVRYMTDKVLRSYAVHRLVYERLVGVIPDGYEIDHLCKTTDCARPDHLEAVPGRTNNMRSESLAARRARQTHCKAGHALEGDNLYVAPNQTRQCKTCRRERTARFFAENPNYKAARRARGA